MIGFYASEPHFRTHLFPIHDLIGGECRADTPPPEGVVVVASAKDLAVCWGRPVIFHEHGIGQSYTPLNPSNPGGDKREHVILFLCTNEMVAEANRKRYPETPSVVVGAPNLDRWFRNPPKEPEELTVCISFKWPNNQCPESNWAWPDYYGMLPSLGAAFPKVIGHAHPRIFHRLAREYEKAGIEPVQDLGEAMERASVWVQDSSSAMYEFAAVTDRPVVALNSSKYRRHVHHGLRFWDTIPGLQVDRPDGLITTVFDALDDPPEAQELRRRAVEKVYPWLDGKGAQRAVEAIKEVLIGHVGS